MTTELIIQVIVYGIILIIGIHVARYLLIILLGLLYFSFKLTPVILVATWFYITTTEFSSTHNINILYVQIGLVATFFVWVATVLMFLDKNCIAKFYANILSNFVVFSIFSILVYAFYEQNTSHAMGIGLLIYAIIKLPPTHALNYQNESKMDREAEESRQRFNIFDTTYCY